MMATVAVAFSGGRDSLALLHATCRAAQALGLQVVALHVHHGLLPEADGWLRSAQRLCARWRRRGWPVRLRWARLDGKPAPGDSLEAWARAGRHAALNQLAAEEGATLLLLAHHRRDQAETWLLQALRSGGPAGLSAMPLAADRQGLVWARPWLTQPREAIEAYVRQHRLRPVDDPSNSDTTLARNRLRLQVWPALTAAFGDAETALAGAARRAQQADAALAELATLDLAPLVDAEGRLAVAAWRGLSPARQANALRAWWRAQTGQGAPQAWVDRLLVEVPSKGIGVWPAGRGWTSRLRRGRLSAQRDVVPALAPPVAPPAALSPVSPHSPPNSLPHSLPHSPLQSPKPPATAEPPQLAGPASAVALSQTGRWPMPGWGGAFEVLAAAPGQAGLSPELLCAVRLTARTGGERFALAPNGLPRSLKKQFQAAGVPAPDRAGPLLWAPDGRLLWVPGLGADARAWAPPSAPALCLRWCAELAMSAPAKPAG